MNIRSKVPRLLAAGALGGVLAAGVAFAVHDLGLFELDGDAINDATPGDDWNQIYCDYIDPAPRSVGGDCELVPESGALVSTFFNDPFETDDDVIVGGKDTLDIEAGAPQDWQWKIGGANDKNDIEHVYAALYEDDVSGDFILYFGLDKLSNNGDANVGFWFLQNEVEQLGDGIQTTDPCVPSGCPFSDGHEAGDVFVAAPITAGGETTTIDVYTWGENALDNNPVNLAQGDLYEATTGAECSTITTGPDNVCGQPNKVDVTAPWPYQFKFSGGVAPSDVFPTATFFEAGLNLSALFEGGIPCISTLMAETRQSQSPTANLEDKAIGSFDLCSIFVQKTGPEKSKVGDSFDYTITITNNGALPLTKDVDDNGDGAIVDSLLGDLSSECPETLAAGESCVITAPYTVPDATGTVFNEVTATYKRVTETTTDTVLGSADHTVTLVEPAIFFDKKAEGSDGPLTVLQGATVDYTLFLRNDSTGDTPPLVCTITDNLLELDNDDTPNQVTVTLASGQNTTVNASKTFPDPDSFTNTATVVCSPEGFENEDEAQDSVTVNVNPAAALATVQKLGDAYTKAGDEVNYTVTIRNIGDIDLIVTDVTDNPFGNLFPNDPNDLVTEPNACTVVAGMPDTISLPIDEECVISFTRTTQVPPDADPLEDETTVTFTSALGGSDTLSDDHTVAVVAPDYTVMKTCISEQPVPAGSSANFRIDIANTGDVNLEIDIDDVVLGIDLNDVLLAERDGALCGAADWGDGSNGCLRIEDGITASGDVVNNQVDVFANLTGLAQVQAPNQIDKSDDAVCEVQQGGASRTQGFWKTHGADGEDFDSPVEFGYTCHIARDHANHLPINLGWKSLTTCADVFGIFWSSPARETTGSKRGKLCQKQLQGSWQLTAAILNSRLTNGAAVPIDDVTGLDLITAMQNALAAGDRKEIIRLSGKLAAYNESGDDVAIIDADGAMIPHADPRGTRDTADLTAGDCN